MYIRTKDGVYEVVGFDNECIIPSPLIKVKKDCCIERITHCCKDDIISQSENLEELCDMFILDETHYMDTSLQEIILYEKCIGKGLVTNIYGAIWTDKGLIYVAKMNDKGELELI